VQCTRQPPLLGQQKDQRRRQFLPATPTTAQEGIEEHQRKLDSRKDNCAIMCWCEGQPMTLTPDGEKRA
jgi:hypothetical protein